MKKLWFMLAMMICILASCSDGGSEEPVNPSPKPEEVKTEITIDSGIISNGLSFGVTEGEQSISFSVNANWTLSVASTTSGVTWCKASATSGSKGSATVKFTVDENTGYDDRSVSVTIKAGSISKTFTITQKGADALLVTTTKYEVVQEGGQIEIEVKANISYQMEISEEAKGWITEAESKGRALTTTKHKLDIAMNENAEKREGDITFKSGDKVETVKVYQAGGAILLLSQNEYTVSDAGDTISVDIKSNIDFGIQMPDVDWISDEASSRGMSSHTLKYIVSANETYDIRSAEIIFYDKNSDLKDTLKVVQAQKDAIIISEKNISVAKEGGTVEVKVNTNVDFEVQIPSDTTWISQTDSRVLTEKNIYLKVEENTSEESRSVEVVLVNKVSQISESITLNQFGAVKAGYADGVVSIATAGTMKKLLGDDYLNITSLKVVGPINGDDVYYLRKMLGGSNFSEVDWGKLTTLDLSEATIVEGGEWYYDNGKKQYYTSSNEIGDYMFRGCKNLQSIVLPNNITSIGYEAFIGTNKLYSIIIPDSVISIGNSVFAYHEGLKSINIGNGVTSIGNDAFWQCFNLKDVTIGKNLKSIGKNAFNGCDNITSVHITDLKAWLKIDFQSNPLIFGGMLYLNNEEVTKIVIPEDVTEIKKGTFSGWKTIKEIIFHDGITKIGEHAFSFCDALTSVTIGNNVTSIGEHAFSFCDALTSVTIGNNVTSIGTSAFLSCKALTSITIPNNVTELSYRSFDGCSALTTVIIGDGVEDIEDYAFYDCTSLTSITIGNNVTSIGDYAFSTFLDCDVLTAFYCHATVPPVFDNKYNVFLKRKHKNVTLYVPARCGAIYKASDWGSYFNNIIEMD